MRMKVEDLSLFQIAVRFKVTIDSRKIGKTVDLGYQEPKIY